MKFSPLRRVLASPGFEDRGALRAHEYLRGLINLWKDVDPGVAEVEDAKRRVAELRYGNPPLDWLTIPLIRKYPRHTIIRGCGIEVS